MKKLLMSVAALATLASASAASAQPFAPFFDPINAREAADARRIAWCERIGEISPRQAWVLRAELRQIERLEARLRFGGLSPVERMVLNRQLARLEAQIRYACNPYDNHGGYGGAHGGHGPHGGHGGHHGGHHGGPF